MVSSQTFEDKVNAFDEAVTNVETFLNSNNEFRFDDENKELKSNVETIYGFFKNKLLNNDRSDRFVIQALNHINKSTISELRPTSNMSGQLSIRQFCEQLNTDNVVLKEDLFAITEKGKDKKVNINNIYKEKFNKMKEITSKILKKLHNNGLNGGKRRQIKTFKKRKSTKLSRKSKRKTKQNRSKK